MSEPEIVQAVRLLEALDVRSATQAFRDLFRRWHDSPPATAPLGSVWKPFLELLHRRGFFADTPERISTSLREIAEIGKGFDLYDLAVEVARCDTALSDCLRRQPARQLPALLRFEVPCDCRRRD